MQNLKKIREYFLNSNYYFIYYITSRLWSLLYSLQLSLEFFKFKHFWNNFYKDFKDNISNCDIIYNNK